MPNPTRRKTHSMRDQNKSKPPPTLGPDITAAAGRQLRIIYADFVEGVPEHCAELLRRLDEPSNEGSKKAPTPPTI